jgi:hypothetical protein
MTAAFRGPDSSENVHRASVQESSHNRTASYGVDSFSSTSAASQGDTADAMSEPPVPAPTPAPAIATYRGDLDYEIPEGTRHLNRRLVDDACAQEVPSL